MAQKKSNPFIKNKYEIIWNIVNSLLAGGMALLGAVADGDLTIRGVVTALVVGGSVAMIKFREYWAKEEKEYRNYHSFFQIVG